VHAITRISPRDLQVLYTTVVSRWMTYCLSHASFHRLLACWFQQLYYATGLQNVGGSIFAAIYQAATLPIETNEPTNPPATEHSVEAGHLLLHCTIDCICVFASQCLDGSTRVRPAVRLTESTSQRLSRLLLHVSRHELTFTWLT
jgi:hypothetical protein